MDANPAWDWSSISQGTSQPLARDTTSSPGASPEKAMPDTGSDSPPSAPEPTPTVFDDQDQDGPQAEPTSARRRFYGPRTCRICLETEEPKFPEVATTFGIQTESSKPIYASDDPELGRLLCPCKCKGSQKYVHEGCLNAWRLANPHATRNFWQCPTCKFTYHMQRLRWAAILGSRITQVILTVIISIVAIFLLGWVADPILDLWFDPVGTITETVSNVVHDVEARNPVREQGPMLWEEQFLKGFLSLGIIGFFKTVVFLNPWDLYLTGVGRLRGNRRVGGRARMDNYNLVMVVVGAVTFLMGVWKVVKAISARVLKRMSDRVLDVSGDDEDDADETAETRKDQ